MNLERVIAGCIRHKDHGALMLIDLDDFKNVNDAHGHDAGDAVLVEFARRLQSVTRSENFAGRLGGDEFVVLIDRLGADERMARDNAVRVGEKVIELTDTPFDFAGKRLRVGASIGIRLFGQEDLDKETAIVDADVAMYRSKRTGKGRAVFFESEGVALSPAASAWHHP
jgi:diguanylate cyclase (GGDEF)-like protein